jgi:hypothetical protein
MTALYGAIGRSQEPEENHIFLLKGLYKSTGHVSWGMLRKITLSRTSEDYSVGPIFLWVLLFVYMEE